MSSLGHNELTRRMINSAGHRSSHKYHKTNGVYCETSDSRPPQMTRFVGPTQDPPGSCRPHMGPMLAPWTLLSGSWLWLWEFLTNKLIKLSLTYFLFPTHKNIIQNTQLLVHEKSWWHHQMETFSTLLALCAGYSPVSSEIPAQRPVTRSFDVFFDLHLIKQLSKHLWGWWFETLSHTLWRHCNVWLDSLTYFTISIATIWAYPDLLSQNLTQTSYIYSSICPWKLCLL